MTTSSTPRRVRTPSWLDLRLIAGAVLVLASVLVGINVVRSADKTDRLWAVAHDLAAGAVLQSDDLHVVAARLPDGSGGYLPASTDVVGQAVTRALSAGELLPRSAVGSPGSGTTVVIPLGEDNSPKIAAGERITVWVSTARCPDAVVLADVTVQDVQSARSAAFASGGGADVVVRVDAAQAQRVIQALALANGVIRAGLLHGNPSASTPAADDLGACGGSAS
jgi:hypothetical protein